MIPIMQCLTFASLDGYEKRSSKEGTLKMTDISLVSNKCQSPQQDIFPVNANPWQTGLWLVPAGAVNSDFVNSQHISRFGEEREMIEFTTTNKDSLHLLSVSYFNRGNYSPGQLDECSHIAT